MLNLHNYLNLIIFTYTVLQLILMNHTIQELAIGNHLKLVVQLKYVIISLVKFTEGKK